MLLFFVVVVVVLFFFRLDFCVMSLSSIKV